ncbi:hypothetical protein [Paragemmobacter ruber]|uniref:Lipoprotein n=1 Tax=Paragemmobacter ruber TaxID=1985673 RepID=A0ABW9Y1I4_9RHOB|nr:hypothetical protein [Rhodobacter ruber]NBE06267.1 hypothetical protein [Rhodobacter ruber]
MPARILPLLALLAACASPSPPFFGAARHEVTVDGRRFTVFHEASRAQVIRHGYASASARADIPALMLRAVALATGCTPVAESFQGDSGERRGRIRC